MQTILDIIKPIKLISGSHSDTATTGQGCAMNVIAYLNGEDKITDKSTCVCVTVRRIVVWLNDYLEDDERQELVPYLLRAMNSATDDKSIINQRLAHVVQMTNNMAGIAKQAAYATTKVAAEAVTYATTKVAAEAAAYATTYAAEAAAYAAAATATAATATAATAAKAYAAAAYATAAADSADSAAAYAATYRIEIKKAAFDFLEATLPKAKDHDFVVFKRAKKLAEITALV